MQLADPYLERPKQIFPTLDDAQLARLARIAAKRRIRAGEVLIEVGAADAPFFVVLEGAIQIVRQLDGTEELITTHRPGEFTGEMNMLAGRRSLFMARASADGADPNTAWLDGCVARDDKGFVKTGNDLTPEDLHDWTLARPPLMLETSIPAVFAVGDVRSGSVKRVASGVGEGSICVQLLHKVLA